MSHTTSISSVRIMSISALRAAVEELRSNGMSIQMSTNKAPRAYYSNQAGMGVAPYVIELPGASYDIGVYPAADGEGYELRTDFFGGTVEKVLGAKASCKEATDQAKLGRLYQMYAVRATEEQAANDGYQVERSLAADGSIQLLVTGYN